MGSQGQSHGVGRYLFGIGLAILAMLMVGLIQPVGAQETPLSCDLFETQPEAQDVLDQDPKNPEFAALDPDGDGIACEELPAVDPSPTGDFTSCEQFETAEDAQRELNTRTDDVVERRFALDADGDGVACEDTFGVGDGERPEILRTCDDFSSQDEAQAYFDTEATDLQGAVLDPDGDFLACENAYSAPTVVVCNEATGTLVETSEENANLGQIDFPYHVATPAEIAAGSCAVTTPGPDTISLTIFKANCPNAAAAEDLYANCEPGGNATFEVATADGDVLGSCTTEVGLFRGEKAGFCTIGDVPFDTRLVITEDVSTGFVPLENPKTLTIERPNPGAADFTPAITFVNLPAEELETPEPTPPTAPVTPKADGKSGSDTVTALPKTGAGTAGEQVQQGPLMPAFLTVLVLTASAIGFRLRNQRTQA